MEILSIREQEATPLWINQSDHIISFHKVDSGSYERLVFPSQDEKMEFVFQKCSSGFRIQ